MDGATALNWRFPAQRVRAFLHETASVVAFRVILIITVLATFRWLYLGVVPLELAADEAYYWDWSRQLDWGYYSKPPMIAWIAALTTQLGGNSAWALRTPAVLCGAMALWGVFATARSLYDERVGWWAFLIAAATPGNAAMSLFMTIDAPFLCAWSFAVWCVWELFGKERSSRVWLPLAILCTGLGLLSKQTMLALIPLTGAWLATRKQAGHPFPGWKFATWAGGSLLFCLPAFVWNFRNDWLTVHHTREHFQWRALDGLKQLSLYLEFSASQAGIVSPLTYVLATVLCLIALLKWQSLPDRERFLLSLGVVPLLAITVLSFIQRVQPNWPVAFHMTGMILLAAWSRQAWSTRSFFDRYRGTVPWGMGVGCAFLMLFYAMPMAMPQMSWVGTALDPLSRLRGWKQIATDVDAIRGEVRQGKTPLLVTMTGRGLVSQLAFYLPDHPRVYHWNAAGTIVSQHDVWGGPQDCAGRDALIILPAEEPVPSPFAAACETLTPVGRVRQERGGQRYDDFDIWIGRNLQIWPAPNPSKTGSKEPISPRHTDAPIASKNLPEELRR